MWIWQIIRYGNFGRSFGWQQPVSRVIGERLALTMVISLSTLVFTWLMAIPIGIYSAVRQYSPGDYAFTFLGFIGFATSNFLLVLMMAWEAFAYFGLSITGLFSPEYLNAAWSLGKVWNMAQRIWVPIVVVGTAGTAGLIRV